MPSRRSSIFISAFAFLLVTIFVCSAAIAQTETATVRGRVSDPSGAMVATATVQLIDIDRGTRSEVSTNTSGFYTFANVQPGRYRMEVGKEGFKVVHLTDLTVNVQDNLEENFRLDVGAVSESVTVEANAATINTTDGSVSTVVDQSYVQNMPLNGRSFQDLILLTPGVVTQTPQGQGTAGQNGEFSVNGQRPEENYYTVDGVSANLGTEAGAGTLFGAGPSGSVPSATALGTTQALVSVDDLQEFRVQSSTYSAEYGRNPGGQFAFETKSGTNQWHGTAYDYLRNNYFDANDWFNNFLGVKEAPLRQNDFGDTLGGPVRLPSYNGKDKTFFFVSYEGLRLLQPQEATINYVPDATLRASVPAPLDQVLNAYPAVNGPEITCNPNDPNDPFTAQGNCPSNGQTGFADFLAAWSNPSSINSTAVRFDQMIGNSRLFFRFSNTGSQSSVRQSSQLTAGAPTVNNTSSFTMRTYTVGLTSLVTTRISNDLRLNYSSNDVTDRRVIDSFGGGVPVDLAQLAALDKQASTFFQIFLPGGRQFALSQLHQSSIPKQWNLVDTIGLSVGRHQLKLGVDYRRIPSFINPANPTVAYDYSSASALQANQAGLVIERVQDKAYPVYTNVSAFVADEWKATSRLNLSIGLRWEVDPAPGVTQGQQPYTIAFTPDPNTWSLAPLGTRLWRTTWYNFAPRLGAAYVVRDRQGWQTVVRGGGGVFFDTAQQLGSIGIALAPGYFADNFESGPFSGPLNLPSVNPPSTDGLVSAFWPHLQLPYTLQWNVSLEQQLGKSQAITLAYVGAHGSRLLKTDVFFPFGAPNPIGSEIQVIANGLTSDYGSGQLQYSRRLSQGLTALASYTWSHCIDYNSQNYLFGYQRGNCDFDIRNDFSGAFSYDVPNVGHGGLMSALLHHWGVDNRFTARSGFPITLLGNSNTDPVTGKNLFSGLDVIRGVPLWASHCANPLGPGQIPCPGGRGLNPKAFALPPIDPSTFNTIRNGNAPRNFVNGFGAWQMDLAVRREFPIYDRLKLQFRAEAFNVFNHPNFGLIDSEFFDNTFGEARHTLAASSGILSSLYSMGGPRSMQFALKVVF